MNNRMFRILLFSLVSVCILNCSDKDDTNEALISAGNYKGLWNSSTPTATFSNLAISAKISEVSPGKFEGSFFISNNFTSCCGGTNDGTINFTSNGDKITGFTWDDTIPGCTGAFNGAGAITSKNNLRIEFIGNDCDGDHTGFFTLSQ